MTHYIKTIIKMFLSIFCFIFQSIQSANITHISGKIFHGNVVQLKGDRFGEKTVSAPWRSSTMHPNINQAFQATGNFAKEFWSPNTVMVTLTNKPPLLRLQRPSHQFYARLEYSKQGNTKKGYSAGINIRLPSDSISYVSWYEFFENECDFSLMHTGNGNIKWVYYGVGGNPAREMQINDNGNSIWTLARGGVDQSNKSENNLILPYGGDWYSKGSSWKVNFAAPKGKWYLIEIFDKINSSPGTMDGWNELRINNQILYSVKKCDMYLSQPKVTHHNFSNIRLGGNYGWNGGQETCFRFFSDIYIDNTFQRVVVGDSNSYQKCKHMELQVPSSWDDSTITFKFNQGSFSTKDSVYIYIVDKWNIPSKGFPIQIGE
jgi:hypothetical protein